MDERKFDINDAYTDDIKKAYAELESAFVEQGYVRDKLQEENEKLREAVARMRFANMSLDTLKRLALSACTDEYFWAGMFLALFIVYIGNLFKETRD